MSQRTNPIGNQKPTTTATSPIFKGVTYIPVVGIFSSSVVELACIAGKYAIKKNYPKAPDETQVITVYKEYNKINLVRNVLSIAMIVGAVALGILSGPLGGILAGVCALSMLKDAYQYRKHGQELQQIENLRGRV